MSRTAVAVDDVERKEGNLMIRHGIGLGGRLAAVAFAMVLVLSLAGDRGRASTVPAVINGQDPLEVLSLKIRPNVIIVLDSSGSMTSRVPGGNTGSGDHPRSRMFQAKDVLYSTIQQNQDKASFMFGNYTQLNSRLQNRTAGDDRFQYYTSSVLSPIMLTDEIVIERANGDAGYRGFESWQWIDSQWNTLHFEENGGPTCAATLPGPFPKFYQTGAALAQDFQNAMNASACNNTYSVSYNSTYGQFTFSRASGSATFQILTTGANNIEEALGGIPSVWGSSVTAPAPPWTLGGPSLVRRSGGGRIDQNNHGVNVGDTCVVSGASPTYFNGTWIVTSRSSSDRFWINLPGGSDQSASGETVRCGRSAHMLLYRSATNIGWIDFHFSETIAGSSVDFYQVRAGRLWNGETIRVEDDGTICGLDFGSAATRTDPPSFTVQLVNSNCGGDRPGEFAVFEYAGADFGGNTRSCRGFQPKAGIIPCDLKSPPAPTQIETIGPFIDLELPFNPDGTAQNYTEAMDGGWAVTSYPLDIQGGAKADGWTPIANSLIDIKGAATGDCLDVLDDDGDGNLDELVPCTRRNFEELWFDGPDPLGLITNPAWASVPAADRAIQNHADPKEKTIVLFVTDGDDTCPAIDDDSSNRDGDDDARRAAYYAERLYERLAALESASSVITYVIGFGGAFSAGEPTRLNWIAWGGSGLGQGQPGQPDVPTTTASDGGLRWDGDANSLKILRGSCTTCQDAFVAPDAATLAATLQAIIDQGASEGEFSAQQSVTESIFEYVDIVPPVTPSPPAPPIVFDPRNPETRYGAIVPTRIISSFSLPGFKGQIKAYQNDGAGNAVLRWSAGDALWQRVSAGMLSACTGSAATGAIAGECSFAQLHASTSDDTIATSVAAIKRRVYTTSRNGVYTFSPSQLVAYGTGGWNPPERVVLWPPNTTVAPNDYTNQGSLDAEIGLPLDTSADPAGDFVTLQNEFGACVGSDRPAGCTSGTASIRMKAARREARDMIFAFMAGAQPSPGGTGGPKRAFGSATGVSTGDILFTVRSWVLADSELATPAVVTPPLAQTKDAESEPSATAWVPEWRLFRDGAGTSRPDSDVMIRQGFGLRYPEKDAPADAVDSRANLKPVMTVAYVPANDMLHAFRAGPCYSPSTSPASCAGASVVENGGEELWGFVPYDQLNALRLRYVNEPQGQDNHVFMLARAVRFSDVFVPLPAGDPPLTVSINGASPTVNGVWRRILYIPRGIGGKYMTALDVTAPGPYTAASLDTQGPVPLWSRGNPDSQDGTAAGADSGTALDRSYYAHMGETWSVPAVVFVDKLQSTLYQTARRPDGVDYALFLGSGYGAVDEGTWFYTLDALSGDVIAAVDVEPVAATNSIDRPGLTYRNALVANAVGFNPGQFDPLKIIHPAATPATRMYIGDVHGRLWKFLTAAPDIAIPVADLGEDQPVGTAVSLLGMPPATAGPVPFIFAVSGNDRRADGPFKMFAFEDKGGDTDTMVGSLVAENDVRTFRPVESRHTRTYDRGDPLVDCGPLPEAVFRGTIQPATSFACPDGTPDCLERGTLPPALLGRVFYGGTRLNLPNTVFAPPTPLACGSGCYNLPDGRVVCSEYPCRSSFDSILYALGAKTGAAAYDLNASGDDAYRIFRDSRIAAISMLADPDPTRGGSSFNPDEGKIEGAPAPPPPPGVPPSSTSATANVVMQRLPGQPPPSVHYGSTVCQ